MSAFVRKYPALCLGGLAMILASIPVALVGAGLLPPAATQLIALSASTAGIILAAIEGRKGGVRELLGRFLRWRASLGVWAFILFFPILPAVVTLYAYHFLFGGPSVDWSGLRPIYTVIPSILMLTVMAGMGEEFGWRGFAMPRLQARHNALVSSLIIGVFWSMWHIPLFFIPGQNQYEWRMTGGLIPAFLGYALVVISGSVQTGWVFNNSKGSVLLPAVMHGATNAWLSYIDVYRGQFGSLLTFTGVTLIVTVIMVLAAGARNLSRTHERDVLPPEEARPAVEAVSPARI